VYSVYSLSLLASCNARVKGAYLQVLKSLPSCLTCWGLAGPIRAWVDCDIETLQHLHQAMAL